MYTKKTAVKKLYRKTTLKETQGESSVPWEKSTEETALLIFGLRLVKTEK